MDDLFSEDDFFSSPNVADDADLLFPLPARRPSHNLSATEDRLYLVPFRWWEDAMKDCYRDSDEIKGAIYESPSLQDDVDSTVVGGSELDWELNFSVLRKEVSDLEGRENHSSYKYALLSEPMWFKALMWHSDYGTENKDLGCDSWDLFPVQIRLSVVWQTGSINVKICSMDNMDQNYRRACKLFGKQSSTIWDFSGQIAKLLKVDSPVPHDDVPRANEEVLLELQIYQSPDPDSLKMNGDAISSNDSFYSDVLSANESSSSKESGGRGKGGARLLGLTGLVNLGNTCFMNSAIQCLAHTPKLVNFFLADYKKEINHSNPLGLNGELALAFGDLLRMLWRPGGTAIAPRDFKSILSSFAPQFSGYNQHDSQEFLSFLLDGLHEDLNRVKEKPYKEVPNADGRADDEVADEYWQNHLDRNDSIVVDLFQGQYRSTLKCPMCMHVSVTFDPFMYLSLPLPSTTMRTMTITVFSNDGVTLPSELTVTVPHYGRCKDLIQALNKACSLGEDQVLLLAEVYNNRILQFLDDLSGSLALIRDSDCLVAYRLPKDIESGQLVVFLHRKEERSHFRGRLRTDMKTFGVPLVSIVPSISIESCVRKEYLKLIGPYAFHGDDISDGNSDYEDSKMEDAGLFSDDDNDDSSTEEEKAGSRLDDFQFSQTDEADQNKSLGHSVTDITLKIFVTWPNRMLYKYDTSRLSLLPEVFKHNLFSIPPHESVSLDKCLEAFLKEEPLGPEDMWYCPNCKKHRQASKRLELWRLPEVLVIHLKRFSYSRFLKEKLETYVDFPIDKLDIGDVIGSSVSNCYKLYAISNHYGGMGGGHYTALGLQDNGWYEFDDSSVSGLSEDSIKSSAAYVLFYQRVSAT